MIVLIRLVFLLFTLLVRYCGAFVILPLRPAFPPTHPVQLQQLRVRDHMRHSHILQKLVGWPVNLSVAYVDFYLQHIGLYLIKVKLGSPPREFEMLLDTGSDVSWVPCTSCLDCPRSSALGVAMNFYDQANSSTGELVHCSHPLCTGLATQCSRKSNQCTYGVEYGDKDQVTGYYVSDHISFDMGGANKFNSLEPFVFGCTINDTGLLATTSLAYDGILGLGPGDMSAISQLSYGGSTPKVFSHCLRGDDIHAGGILALGEIIDPTMVYTPLVPAMHYNVILESIAVNGKILPIDPALFTTSQGGRPETFIDSGTSLVYLPEAAYDAFVNAINLAVSKSVKHTIEGGEDHYIVSTSLITTFPSVSLNFAEGASMVLKPEEYMLHIGYYNHASVWGIAFQKENVAGYTILGDIILRNKIIVYDLDRLRIGWANYNCSLPVNVSTVFSHSGSLTDFIIVSTFVGVILCIFVNIM